MKKSLLALAALSACCGVAMAQSSVTLAGKANIGFAKVEGQKANMANGVDGSSSRVIIRGVEDLGGGLSAKFHFEHGLSPDTGAADAVFWQRQAWGALAGGFGEVRLGRQYTLGFFGDIGNMPSTAVDPQLAAGLGFGGMGARNNDQIQYWSPRMGGFQLRASYQLAGDNPNRITELGGNFALGGLTVNATAAKAKGTSGTTWHVNGAYKFGPVTLAAGYTDKAGKNTGKGPFVRVVAPIGPVSLFAGMARNQDTKVRAHDAGAYYSISKRTSLYVVYGDGNKTLLRYLGMGVDHNF